MFASSILHVCVFLVSFGIIKHLSNRINLFMVINIWGIIIYDSASFPILWACYKSLITVITLKIVFYKGMIIKLTNEDTVTKVYIYRN
jgi:hypothetical protein